MVKCLLYRQGLPNQFRLNIIQTFLSQLYEQSKYESFDLSFHVGLPVCVWTCFLICSFTCLHACQIFPLSVPHVCICVGHHTQLQKLPFINRLSKVTVHKLKAVFQTNAHRTVVCIKPTSNRVISQYFLVKTTLVIPQVSAAVLGLLVRWHYFQQQPSSLNVKRRAAVVLGVQLVLCKSKTESGFVAEREKGTTHFKWVILVCYTIVTN